MNPWLAAMLAAAGVWLLHSRSSQQAQNQGAAAGTQAGAGQTSDQGGAGFSPENPIIPYQGGVTQPVSTMSYTAPGGDSGGSVSGSGSGSIPSWPQYTGPTTIDRSYPSYTGPSAIEASWPGGSVSSSGGMTTAHRPGNQL